VATLAA